MPEDKNKLELAGLIKGLREQLNQAQEEAKDKSIIFKVEDVELELEVYAEKSIEGGVDGKLFVLTSKLKGSKKDIVTHRIKLKLKAQKVDGGDIIINDDDEI